MSDPALVIAKEFCSGHGYGSWPCAACRQRATNALRLLAGQGTLIDHAGDPTPTVLSDPTENTPGAARRAAPLTSRTARLDVWPKTGTQRARILDALVRGERDHGRGWTDDDLILRTGMPHQSVGPRRGELVAGGWIEDSGLRRPTRSGAPAIVWELTAKARAHLGIQPITPLD